MPPKTYYFARYIVFIIISLCLFYGCDTSQDSYLSKNQENATTSLVNPFYRMLDIATKLSFIPQEKDIVQDNADFLTTITTQDSQTLWQDALRVPLDKEYSKWQTLENEAKTYQQRQEYHTKRMQSVRDMSFAYGLYVLKISMDFTQEFIDSPAGATNFCWEFDLVFGDEKMWYAMGVMGLDGAYLEPLDSSLEKWILQDEALRTLYGLIRTYQKPIIESYRQRCSKG